MNSTPKSCIVVEDTLPGVQAAISAGMKVVAYTPDVDRWDLEHHGAITFSTMHQLPDLLKKITEESNGI